jgi:flagellar operon protein
VSHQPVDPTLLTPGIANPQRVAETAAPAAPARSFAPDGPAFGEVLAQRTAGVQFSGHAMQRIERRQIDVSPQTLVRLQEGVTRAAGKGARDSVVLIDGTAFVVSVKNRTVITAVDPGHMRDHVFTNIDSAVIA